MLIQDENKLKLWISHVVEDISDAEPDALAKYVIALVKKPHSDADLEKLCSDKLSVFLQTHTDDFVNKLFATLKSGEYLTHKSTVEQNVKKQEEEAEHDEKLDEKLDDVVVAETDELVLTDPEPESEHELEPSPTEKVAPKKIIATQSKSKESVQHSKSSREREIKPSTKAEFSRSSKEDSSRKLAPAELPRKTVQLSPNPTVTKPPRKRISPPRSTSAERRAERRQQSPPIRRRIIAGNVDGGGNSGGGLRVPNRYHRDTRRAVRSKSRSRSPHIRKEKRAPETRRRCRDFHEKGFCMRGDACPHDHGPDPVVVEDSALEKMVRSGAGTVFDPTSAYGVNPPPPGMESTASSIPLGTMTEGYNPEVPALPSVTAGIDFSVPPPPIPQQMVQRPHQLIYPPGTAPPATSILQPPFSSGIVQIRPAQENALTFPVQTTAIYGTNPTGQISSSTFGGGGTGNGMMMMKGGGGRFKPYSVANRNPALKSLLVKKVPAELNRIGPLDQHFSKFGQVTNVQVQYEGRLDTALITFKTRRDAMAAYKSTEPIFNNRFIKVFWQNDAQAQTADVDGNVTEGGSSTAAGVAADSGTGIGPTIPLVTGPTIKSPPKILPRYFTKTFAKPTIAPLPDVQKQEESESNAEESVTKMTAKTEEMPPKTITENTAETGGSIPAPSTAPPPIQNQILGRPFYGGPKVAAMKRKADKEKIGKLMELHKMKTDLYSKLVNQQKMLLQKLKDTKEKEQKEKLMEILKKTEGPAKKVKAELEELGAKIREVQQQQRQMVGPKKRRMSLIVGQSGDNGQKTMEDGATISSPKVCSPNKKLLKLCRVVYVSNCPQEHSEKLIIHMEKFGDLFDYDINTEPHMFTYKNPVDAQKAVAEAVGSFTLSKIKVEWAPTAKNAKEVPVIPDRERKPSEQITPKDLLASLDYDEEEEEAENAAKEEESDDNEEAETA